MEFAAHWQSACVPSGIRRPWTVFHEDLEDKVADAEERNGVAMPAIKEQLRGAQALGALPVFRKLPAHTQRTYAEVSLMELSAFVVWSAQSGLVDVQKRDDAWEVLDCDDKAEFVPDDPRALLAKDPVWQALLADGTPRCGVAGSELAVTRSGDGSNSGGSSANSAVSTLPPYRQQASLSSAKPVPTTQPASKIDTTQRSAQEPSGTSSEKTKGGRLPGSRSVQRRAEASKRTKPSFKSQRGGKGRTLSPPTTNRPQRSCRVVPSSTPEPLVRRQVQQPARSKFPSLRAPVVENLCPEALETACCICSQSEATDENDLALCDRCDRGFHQLCHDPPVSHFGRPEDQWFCGDCTAMLAEERGLSLKTGDFVWAAFSAGTLLWPARVLRIDFTSAADTRPYWVQFFDSVHGQATGAWVSESQAAAWAQGPAFGTVKDARRRLAVRLAEADGAAPISGSGEAVAPTPLSTHLAPAAKPPVLSAASRSTKRPRRAASAPEDEDPAQKAAGAELKEMRGMIAAARLRQARLELQLEEAGESAK